jgi:hypothetical protein
VTDDIVSRLRAASKPQQMSTIWTLTVVRCSLLIEAADELERLAAYDSQERQRAIRTIDKG